MDGFISVNYVQICTIFLAAVVHASLQLGLGTLLLLYHASLGKHIRKKTKILVTNYIFGAGFLIALIVSAFAFLISTTNRGSLSPEMLGIAVSIMLVLAIIIWFFYYKTRRSTEPWLPKAVSRYITNRAKLTESNTESFALGMLTALAEMPFSAILMVVAGNAILALPEVIRIVAFLAYVVIAILPLFVLRFFIRHGRTVVDVQKWRVKNKNFLKIMSGIGFMTLAIFIIAFRLIGE